MTQWLTTWGSLVLTAVLVGVTGWYAYLTKSLAKSSDKAAESARIAAEASSKSVAAALASVRVEFAVSPRYGFYLDEDIAEVDDGMELSAVDVHANGATLFVHWCQLMSAGYLLSDDAVEEYLYGVELPPNQGHTVRMHKGETETFDIPAGSAIRPGEVVTMSVKVWYSLTEDAPIEPVWIDWNQTGY